MFNDPRRRDAAIELLRHGREMEDAGRLVMAITGQRVVDPSSSDSLRALGVGSVTSLLEVLCSHQLVESPAPFSSAHGPWIGYRLSPKGRAQADKPTLFRSAIVLPEGLFPSGAQASIQTLLDESERTISVGAWCATVALYGRVLESMCLALAIKRGVFAQNTQRRGFDAILTALKNTRSLPDDDVLRNALQLGKAFRNVAVHPSGWTADQAEIESELIATLPSESDALAMQGIVKTVVERLGMSPTA